MPFIVDRTAPTPVFITKKIIGGAEKIQAKEVVAGTDTIVVEPDEGFDALSSCTILPYPMLEYYVECSKVVTYPEEHIFTYNEEVR